MNLNKALTEAITKGAARATRKPIAALRGDEYAASADTPATAPAPHHRRGPAKGVQSVKFSFFQLSAEARRMPEPERAALGEALTELLDQSTQSMLTRAYSTIGTRVKGLSSRVGSPSGIPLLSRQPSVWPGRYTAAMPPAALPRASRSALSSTPIRDRCSTVSS